jgi:N-acetylmuramoyl-L-alanine amidase
MKRTGSRLRGMLLIAAMGMAASCRSGAAGEERGELGAGARGRRSPPLLSPGTGSGSESGSGSASESESESESESGSGSGSESGSGTGSGSGSGSGSSSEVASASALPIIDLPIAWSDERAALTLDYRRRHESADAVDLTIVPRVIVLHYTGGGSARGTKAYFDRLTMEASRAQLSSAGKVNVSSHYLIDRDGTIYRLQPETRFARHCIGLNHVAIGIENVGDEKRWKLTEAQVQANATLVRELTRRFSSITHLLGHLEVMKFRAHPYFVERDPAYRNSKSDPGARFLAAVRAQVTDLGLQGLGSP